MPLFGNALAGAAGSGGAAAFRIDRSLRFNGGDSAYLSRTPSSAGNRKKWTWSSWVKRSELGRVQNIFRAVGALSDTTVFQIRFMSDDTIGVVHYSYFTLISDAVFRDVGAWLHLVVSLDVDQSSNSDKLRFYINGSELTSWSTDNRSGLSTNAQGINQASVAHEIGGQGSSEYLSGYLAEIHFVDGQALAPTDFGEFDADTGVWNPIKFTGSHGTNGFHLDFSNESNLGKDSAGSNDWTANNLVGELGSRQGYKGGTSYQYSVANAGGGGGGGAGAPGGNAVSGVTAGAGGAGRTSTITGSSVTYGGGGGGGSWGTAGGAGGAGGGGAGKLGGSSTGAANPGTNGLGGGGGGAGYTNADWQSGGAGGSGRVIIRYPSSHGALTASHSGAQTTVGNDYVYQWTTVGTGTITFPGSSSINVQYLVLGGGGGAEFGGGGGGGVLEGTLSVTGGTNHTVVVGAGGTAPAYPSAANSGGSSTFSSITALGGGRGGGGDSSAFAEDGGSGGGGGTQANNNAGGEGVPGPASGLDSLLDSPDNYEASSGNNGGNYCTWNVLDKQSEVTLANGNLDATFTGPNGHGVSGTLAVSSGKFYWEVTVGANTSLGIHKASVNTTGSRWTGGRNYSWGYAPNGQVVHDSSYSNYGTAHTNGDIVGVAFDADNGKLYFSLNGTWQNSGNPATGTNPAFSGLDTSIAYVPHIGYWTSPGTNVNSLNAGQRPFAISSVPTGFKSLCTQNLDDPAFDKGSDHFEAKPFVGNGGTNTITGLSFSPSLSWIKRRNSNGSHSVFDTLRGVTKRLLAHDSSAETTETTALTAFNSDGFTLGSGGTANGNNDTFISWNWNFGANSNKTYTVTVVNDSGNKFRFDGSNTSAVTLDLAEGSTYIFDQSDSSNAGHPIRFGTSANGTNYTTGVTHTGTPGQAGAKTTLVLGTGVSTLYYSCQNHSGMGGQINTNSTAGATVLVGSLNSSVYLSNAVYSNSSNFTYTGTSGFASGYGLDKIFDGKISTHVDQVDSWSTGTSAHLTWTPATAIPVTNSLRIYGRWYTTNANNQYLIKDVVTINGSSTELQDTAVNSTYNHWFDLTDYIKANNITSITEIKGIAYPTGGNRLDPQWHAIEVDGKILVDSNQTPPNVPSIASTVQANQTAGQSAVLYTGTDSQGGFAHGLSQAPDLVIIKARNRADGWPTFHTSMGPNKFLNIHATDAVSNSSAIYNAVPSSKIVYLHEDHAVNGPFNYIAYCFHAVPSYSAFGSFTGTGAGSTGPFNYCGFQPAIVVVKRTDSTGGWSVWDTARDADNAASKNVWWDDAYYEIDSSQYKIDILSNGFRMRSGHAERNASGGTYVWLAFAESPLKYARAR
jgi:hypothetical protein|tara:strand:+ start:342 stop:4397 length:4056 start_codon:yes stop_codon:yes gene_type:complete